MNPVVAEWVEKAEGDFLTAQREFNAERDPNFDAVCYHAQQCVEKLMKALLIGYGVTPPRTHHLLVLDELLRGVLPQWRCDAADLRLLSLAATQFRYPGSSATFEDAQRTLEVGRSLRTTLIGLLKSRQ